MFSRKDVIGDLVDLFFLFNNTIDH
jgi:hypothetical protein